MWRSICVRHTVARSKNPGFKIIQARFSRAGDPASVNIDLRIASRSIEHYIGFERKLEGDTVYQLMRTRELSRGGLSPAGGSRHNVGYRFHLR
jgi:hypothetical protein